MKLPKNWEEKELGELSEILMGQSPPSKDYNTESNGLPFFQGKTDFGKKHPTPTQWCSKPLRVAKKGDILLSVRAPVGPVNIATEECCIGRGLSAIRANKNLDSNFLYFFMKMNEKKLENKGTGSTFKAINRKEIEKIKVLVPSLSIQKRIVSILERAEKLKEKRKQANELMSKLPQSVFLEMFQDYINDAKKFVEIGELCEVKGGKRVPKGEQFSDVPTKHPYLRVTDMVDFGINQEGLKYIKDDIFERIKNYTITKEDVYITIAGTIGLSGIIPNSLNGASLTENAAKLVIKDKEKVNRIFLANIVASNIVQSQIKIRTGVVGVPKLALQRIKTIKIPLPPLSLQKQFASHIENINTLRQKQNESTESSNNLFDSLLQKAFNGELVT